MSKVQMSKVQRAVEHMKSWMNWASQTGQFSPQEMGNGQFDKEYRRVLYAAAFSFDVPYKQIEEVLWD